jgi:hypothetical protein
MKKFLLLLILPVLILTGCTSGNVPSSGEDASKQYGKTLNQLKHTELWDNNVEAKVYLLGVDKIDEYLDGFSNAKKGQEIVAVRYELKNLTNEDIDLTGFNFGNGGFDNPSKPLGTLNYSDVSLHQKLEFPTFPSAWAESGKWILPANGTISVSFDWIVENKNYKMYYYWKMPFDKEYRSFEVDLKP